MRRTAVCMLVGLALGGVALAQDTEEELGWKSSTELAYVLTSGNAEASTVGFKSTVERLWEEATLTLRANGVRVDTTTFTRFAVGTPGDFDLVEEETDETTAESYGLSGRYDREISETFFWYGGLGWERNRFAGIDNRYVATGGVGNVWIDRDDLKFKTDYALTVTREEPVLEAGEDTFAGVRLSWSYENRWTETTTFANVLILDENLEETSDWRGDLLNTLSVTMTNRLALKVGLQLLYDNEPAFVGVPLFDGLGTPTGDTVLAELDELDTIFTTSLVIDF